MNKRETHKAMRAITWRVCMLGEYPTGSPELASLDAAIRSAGYTPTRKNMGGFDGIAFEGNGAALFCAAPRYRKPGKKQSCTLYELADVRAFDEASAAICAGDYARALELSGTIGAASLRNEIAEGLDRLEYELGSSAVASMMEQPEPADELETVRALLGYPADVEVSQKRAGCCIWASGNTRPHKDTLKAFGFRWAPKRSAWYWKPAA